MMEKLKENAEMSKPVWDKNRRLQRSEEAFAVMCEASRCLKPVFKKAVNLGLSPDGFCFIVFEEAERMALGYILDEKMRNDDTTEYLTKISKNSPASIVVR